MWKRRAEIALLALAIAVAGGSGARPHVHVSTPDLDLAGLAPVHVVSPLAVARVASDFASDLLD